MGDKIVVMHDGRIEQIGSPLELYDHPANQFVAGFIGSPAMNFLPGTLRRNGGAAQRRARRRHAAATRRCDAGGSDGQPVVFGTRPEHLTLADGGGIPVAVVVMEPTGADTFVACRHEGADALGGVPRAPRLRARQHDPPAARPAARASVRRRQRRAARRLTSSPAVRSTHTGDMTMTDDFNRRKFLEGSAGVAAAATLGTGAALFAPAGAGADADLQAREGRQAARAALEPLRAGRHRRLHGQRQEVHREDRHRGARRQRRLGRRAPEGRGGGQHRRRPGHHPVDQRRRQPLPGQAARRDRPGRVPRQEVRRLVPGRRRPSCGPTARSGSACRSAPPAR